MSVFDGQSDLLRTLIASCATFQTVTGQSTVAAAKTRCVAHEALDETNESATAVPYPRAIVADGGVIERDCVGTSTWRGVGSLWLVFQFAAPADKTTTLAQREWFTTKTSTIMREAEVIADSRATPSGYSTSHLRIRRYRRTTGPQYVQPIEREQPDETANPLGPLWEIEFEVEY